MTKSESSGSLPGFLLCLTYHLPNISGLTLSAHAIAQHLVSLGHPVRIVAGRVPPDLPEEDIVEGIRVVRVKPWFRLGKALVMPGYARAVWRACDGMDVVNVHLPCLDAATVAIVARLRRKRLIVSHISSMSRARLSDRVMRAVASVPHMIAGALAHRVQVVSTDYAEQSTFCRMFRHKVVTAPLPIHLHLFDGESYPKRTPRAATAERPFRIGYVGRIARQKSLGVLLEALPLITRALGPNVVIDLVGPAAEVVGETYWQDILDRATASGGSVRYLGTRVGRDLADAYAALDVMVLPSVDRLESFGLVQVEAMLRAVPVVASDLPGMRMPVAVSGMGRLFAPGDPVALANAVVDVLQNGPPRSLDAQDLLRDFGDEPACAPYVDLLATAGPRAPAPGKSAPISAHNSG